MIKVGLSIATYNEALNISHLLDSISHEIADTKDVSFEILVVDDNSPDGTAEIVRKSAKQLNRPNFNVSVLVRKVKDGYGRACIAGFKQLLDQKVDFVMQMDADMSHNPIYLPAFIKAAKDGHDFVIASRYIKGGQTPDWPWHRRFLSKYGNAYTRFFLGRAISDYTGGFNLYSAKLLKSIDLDTIRATGYGFLIELKYRAKQHATSIQQIAITFNDRQHGQSKIPKSTLIKNFILVPRLRFTKQP